MEICFRNRVAVEGGRESSLNSGVSSEVAAIEEAAAAAQSITCVAILMQHPTNSLVMKKIGGLETMTELIQDSEHNEVSNGERI